MLASRASHYLVSVIQEVAQRINVSSWSHVNKEANEMPI